MRVTVHTPAHGVERTFWLGYGLRPLMLASSKRKSPESLDLLSSIPGEKDLPPGKSQNQKTAQSREAT